MKQTRYLTVFILSLIFCSCFCSVKTQKKNNVSKKSHKKYSRSVALLAMIMHLWKPSKYSIEVAYNSLNSKCGNKIRRSKLSKSISNMIKKSKSKTKKIFPKKHNKISHVKNTFIKSLGKAFRCQALPANLRRAMHRMIHGTKKYPLKHQSHHRKSRHAKKHHRKSRHAKKHHRKSKYAKKHHRKSKHAKKHHRKSKHAKKHHKRQRKLARQILNIVNKAGASTKSIYRSIAEAIVAILRKETSSSQIVSKSLPASNPNNTLRASSTRSNYNQYTAPTGANFGNQYTAPTIQTPNQPSNNYPQSPQHQNYNNGNHYTLVD